MKRAHPGCGEASGVVRPDMLMGDLVKQAARLPLSANPQVPIAPRMILAMAKPSGPTWLLECKIPAHFANGSVWTNLSDSERREL